MMFLIKLPRSTLQWKILTRRLCREGRKRLHMSSNKREKRVVRRLLRLRVVYTSVVVQRVCSMSCFAAENTAKKDTKFILLERTGSYLHSTGHYPQCMLLTVKGSIRHLDLQSARNPLEMHLDNNNLSLLYNFKIVPK